MDVSGECRVMPTDAATHLHRIDPACNMARYYSLSTMPSLFGDICVVREWGRIGRPGRIRIDLYQEAEEAHAARLAIEHAKRRRGYHDASGNG
ncbi:WGR domain-containing protein [Mesorhizobium sp. B3-2-1]|uniref:WGR domain-containing protein n=1 Tax=Mesorhizobium sp. B3-2-1 TaxID=2589891 RepID=UPI0032B24D23